MNFFVPGIDDPAEAEAFHAILRRLAIEAHGQLSARRIQSLTYARRGELHTAAVGETDTALGAPCVAIFEAGRGGLYFVYVEGSVRGNGHLVTAPLTVECFDE